MHLHQRRLIDLSDEIAQRFKLCLTFHPPQATIKGQLSLPFLCGIGEKRQMAVYLSPQIF